MNLERIESLVDSTNESKNDALKRLVQINSLWRRQKEFDLDLLIKYNFYFHGNKSLLDEIRQYLPSPIHWGMVTPFSKGLYMKIVYWQPSSFSDILFQKETVKYINKRQLLSQMKLQLKGTNFYTGEGIFFREYKSKSCKSPSFSDDDSSESSEERLNNYWIKQISQYYDELRRDRLYKKHGIFPKHWKPPSDYLKYPFSHRRIWFKEELVHFLLDNRINPHTPNTEWHKIWQYRYTGGRRSHLIEYEQENSGVYLINWMKRPNTQESIDLILLRIEAGYYWSHHRRIFYNYTIKQLVLMCLEF